MRLDLLEERALIPDPGGRVLEASLICVTLLFFSSALAQIAVDKQMIKSSGEAGFVLWRSIYLSKQVGRASLRVN